ncbi:glutamyl-tRNA (Gln) amidotransferase subunit A [Actinidia rufa]|uniref:Glutamyl-tRNA (Gln) amidotransferase subunit A n=1 Tax=Actinidia rufa TaxID=165716 RepID=A0A7J0EUJ8_9ERIC|nr:glutamyl-tRNA (Gln) amidotransferase subunit A [Actinidia rufa]
MERKQGFFSALKEEVMRGLSPARSRAKSPGRSGSPMSGLLRRRSHRHVANPEMVIGRSGSLTPLMEGPDPDGGEVGDSKRVGLGQWVKGQLSRTPSVASSAYRRSDLRLLLGVMGAPLAPVHVSTNDPLPHLSIKDTPIETSSAQYILQQYTAASGGQRLQNSIRNAYAMGKVKMLACEFETAGRVMKNRHPARDTESGGFVLWQMNPDMWYVELAVGGSKVHAGCNGKLVWRHTPWLGAHTAKGPVRPLRRALQGLDPRTTASMFADARCIGEKKINAEDCFILKLCADPQTLKSRIYWETTINSFLDDYRPVEGIMIAHSGRSVVTLFRFGEMAMSHTKTRMEEAWTIEEVAFNVPGLSIDCFIPPADLRSGSISEVCELLKRKEERVRLPLHPIGLRLQRWRKIMTAT